MGGLHQSAGTAPGKPMTSRDRGMAPVRGRHRIGSGQLAKGCEPRVRCVRKGSEDQRHGVRSEVDDRTVRGVCGRSRRGRRESRGRVPLRDECPERVVECRRSDGLRTHAWILADPTFDVYPACVASELPLRRTTHYTDRTAAAWGTRDGGKTRHQTSLGVVILKHTDCIFLGRACVKIIRL